MFLLLFYLGGAFANLDWLWVLQAPLWEPVDRFMLFLGCLLSLSVDIATFFALKVVRDE